MNEIWKPVAGFDGYEVSNFGRVRRLHKTTPPRILQPSLDKYGYLYVNLWHKCNSRKCKVHRLVAVAFIPNPESKPEVNHRNGIKTDNHVENLEWATARENTRHAIDTGLLTFSQGEDHHNAKLTNEQAHFVRENPDGLTCAALAEMFGVTPATIGDVQCGKKYQNAGGTIRN